jgi:hypothetical protein
MRTGLWITRIGLACLAVWWLPFVAKVTYLLVTGGREAMRGWFSHVAMMGSEWGTEILLRNMEAMYEFIIFMILMTWFLREFHGLISRRLGIN